MYTLKNQHQTREGIDLYTLSADGVVWKDLTMQEALDAITYNEERKAELAKVKYQNSAETKEGNR